MSASPTFHWVSADGIYGAISAGEYTPGMGRSKTFKDLADADGAVWEPTLTTAPGPKSAVHFTKIRLADVGLVGVSTGRMPRPSDYGHVPPPERSARKKISDYPHTCPTCGGKMLWLFTSQEHEGGGDCPGARAKKEKR